MASQTIGTVLVNIEANTQKLIDGFNSAEKRVDSAVSTMKKSVLGLTTAYLSFEGIVGGGKMFLQQADAMTSAASRLKLVTANSQELLNIQKQLFDISQKSSTGYLETIDLYTDISRSAKEYNIEQSKLLAITDSISKATAISGKDAVSTQAALTQLGQAFSSNFKGVGQELGSLKEQAPRVYQAMIEGMGTTSDKFKKMAEGGKLSTEIIIEALLKGSKSIDSEFGAMTITVEQGFTKLSNTTLLLISDINNITGASNSFANTFKDISESIDKNRSQIIEYSQITSAVIGKNIDNFLLFGADIKNTTELLLDSVGIMTFGALEPISSIILDITKALHDLNLTSDETLQNSQGLYNFANKGLTNFKASAVNNLADIDNAYKKANVSIEDRIKLQEEEWKISSTNNVTKKKTGTENTKDDSAIIKIMGTEYQKFNLDLEDNIKKLKESGATQAEVDKYRIDSIKDFKEKQLKDSKKTNDELQKQAEETNKALLDIAQIGMSEYDKGLISITEKTNEWRKAGVSENDILIAQNKLLDELKSKTLFEAQKEDLSYYERKIQLMDDSIGKETELQGIAYTTKILEIENSTKSIAEKDKLIAKETELFNLTVQNMNYKYDTEFQDTMSNFYDDMLDSQLALNNAVYDFGSGFDGVSSKIGNVSKSIAAMSSLELTAKKEASKLDKKYIDQFVKYADQPLKIAELEKQYTIDTNLLKEQGIQAQLNGYANIAGSMSTMFNEGSREAASFQLIEAGLALSSGIRAILTQGSGDPYTAFARMAAMAATVSSMLGNIGIAFGMNTTTTTSDSFSSLTVNDGSGSILGDSKKQSKSITNALSTLEDFAKPEYQTLLSMNSYLETIASNIGGVASLLVQNSDFALGTGAVEYNTGYKNNLNLNTTSSALLGGAGTLAGFGAAGGFGAIGGLSVLGPAGLAAMAVDKLLLGGMLTNTIGGLFNSVLGGIFGKTSVSQKLKDSGIYFADTLLTSAIEQFDGEAYQTIATTTTKKSWFSKSSSTSIKSYFDALDTETERQFSLVLDGLYNTVLVAGTALDSSSEQTANSLSNFVVSLGKISLKDKTGTEIQEILTNAFGEIGDDIAKTAFPALTSFQQVGEGVFETLTRVATGMEDAEYYIGRLGNSFVDITYTAIQNKQGDVGFEALRQSIDAFDESAYGANNNLVKLVNSLDGTAEELYTVYTTLDELRDKLIFLGQSSQGISSSMIYGAGSVDSLSSGFSSYFENFLSESEQLDYKTQQLSSSFASLGILMPTTNLAFKELLSGLDLTSVSGQELYGRLITLSDSFADISSSKVSLLTNQLDSTNSSISSLQDISTNLESVISSLRSSIDTSSSSSLDKFARSMTTSLLLAQTGDYTSLANSVKDTISYSNALNNSDYFTSARDMQYAQAVAANQFESMNLNLDTELSVLQEIADNTNNMITALSNLTTAVNALQESSSATANNTSINRYVS